MNRAIIEDNVVRNTQYRENYHHNTKIFQELEIKNNSHPVFFQICLSISFVAVRAPNFSFADRMQFEGCLIVFNVVANFSRVIEVADIIHSFAT